MIGHITTDGVFTLDGQSFDVTNNVWLIGDDDEVVVIDAAHDAAKISEAVGGRQVPMIVCTHGHNDHINAAVELAGIVDAPGGAATPTTGCCGMPCTPTAHPTLICATVRVVAVGGAELTVMHTPGHSPRLGLPARRRRRVLRRHPVPGRAGRDGALLL